MFVLCFVPEAILPEPHLLFLPTDERKVNCVVWVVLGRGPRVLHVGGKCCTLSYTPGLKVSS